MNKKRIIIIGDCHGRSHWKQIDPSKYDKIIFLGDYMDSWQISSVEILQNLKDIIDFKLAYPDKVVLLIGNHDIHYMMENLMYDGFRAELLASIHLFKTGYSYGMESRFPLFQLAYQMSNLVITHAGISSQWFYMFEKEWFGGKIDKNSIANLLNEFFAETTANPKNRTSMLLDNSGKRGGAAPAASPIWTDMEDLAENYLLGINQIVGHTHRERIEHIYTHTGEVLAFVDCQFDNLSECPQYMFYEFTYC